MQAVYGGYLVTPLHRELLNIELTHLHSMQGDKSAAKMAVSAMAMAGQRPLLCKDGHVRPPARSSKNIVGQ
jgi:hypothetical protein